MESNATPEIAMAAGAILLLIGIGFLTWGIRLILRQRRVSKEHARATGTVVEITLVEGMDNSIFHCPIVEFTAAEQKLRLQCLGSTQDRHPVGSSVPILYNPARPSEAEIVGEGSMGVVILIALAAFPIGLGLVFLVIGLYGRWAGGFQPLSQ